MSEVLARRHRKCSVKAIFTIAFADEYLTAGVAIALAFVARLAAFAIPVLILRPFREFSAGVAPIMTWGGLKGGVSVARALSLPDSEWKPPILTATYLVVIFSIIVQGLTVAGLTKQINNRAEARQ